MKNLLEVFEQ